MKAISLFVIAALATGCGHRPQLKESPPADFRNAEPKPLERPQRFDAPVPSERTLDNGLRVLVAENHALPLVSVELVVLTGVNGEPQEKAGIANLTARLLLEGTAKRGALELSRALEDLAAESEAYAQQESSRVHLGALAATLPATLALLAELVTTPGFREADVERLRSVHQSELLQKRGDPRALADDAASRELWGKDHPFGQPSGGTLETLAATSAGDVRQFHSRYYRPANAVLIFAGDVTAAEAERLAREQLGAWQGGAVEKPSLPPPPETTSKTLSFVPLPGSQSQVWRATLLPFGAADPRAVTARVLNFPLGGLFTSRLNMNIRETKGYSYGVLSSQRALRERVVWLAAGGIVADKTAEALVEYGKELARLAEGGVTDAELAQAKQAYVQLLPAQLETNDRVATAIGNMVVQGLPLDYFRTLPDRVRATTREEVSKLAAELAAPMKWTTVVVGPQEIEEKVRAAAVSTAH